jgi:hypothetical protein
MGNKGSLLTNKRRNIMAINPHWILAGLDLIKFVLEKIWDCEKDKKKTGQEKHEFIKPLIEEYLEQNGKYIDDIDAFIYDIINIMNDHKFFTKGE